MWDAVIDDYLNSLRAAGRAAGTIRLHRHYLTLLARACPDPVAVSRRDLEAWLAGQAWKPETRKSARSVVVTFYRWAASMRLVETSPAADLLTVTIPRALPRPAPEAAFDRAMAGASWSVRVMLALARYGGLRCVEIAAVHSRDLTDDMLYVIGKGGKQRVVPILDPELAAAIRSVHGYLFPGRDGGHVTPAWISKQLARALPDGWTAHTLRHAFATRSYAVSPDLLALAEVLGHARVDTTRRYAQIPADSLRAVVNAAARDRPGRTLVPRLRAIAA